MRVVDSRLQDLPRIPSASKMDEQTYLAMKVLRPDRKRANEFPELKGVIGDTKSYIKDDPQFQAYIGHIKDGQKSVLGWKSLGLFQPVRSSQLGGFSGVFSGVFSSLFSSLFSTFTPVSHWVADQSKWDRPHLVEMVQMPTVQTGLNWGCSRFSGSDRGWRLHGV